MDGMMKNVFLLVLILLVQTTQVMAEPAIPYGTPLSVEQARKVASVAIAEAKKNHWLISVAVVDPRGEMVYFERGDGTEPGLLDLAIEKAKVSATYKQSTKAVLGQISAGTIQYKQQTGSIFTEGGEPINIDGKIVGAIGVSGARPEQDGICAKAGSKALIVKVKATGVLTGRILTKNGEPLVDGKVHFFREGSGPVPSQSHYWRTPDEKATIGNDGRFSVRLSEGRYYISVIRKISKDEMGPPVAGDLVYPDNRKELSKELQSFPVVNGEKTDIGTIAGVVPFKKHEREAKDSITAIEGTVTDPQGHPVSGAIVLAFPTKNLIGKPLYVSERTGSDGKYIMKVANGGEYYLKSRTSLAGGQPPQGELIGIYGTGDSALAVKVKNGETVSGFGIRAIPFNNSNAASGRPDPSSRKPDGFGPESRPGPDFEKRGNGKQP